MLHYTVASGDHVEEIQFGREEGGASSYDAAAAQKLPTASGSVPHHEK